MTRCADFATESIPQLLIESQIFKVISCEFFQLVRDVIECFEHFKGISFR